MLKTCKLNVKRAKDTPWVLKIARLIENHQAWMKIFTKYNCGKQILGWSYVHALYYFPPFLSVGSFCALNMAVLMWWNTLVFLLHCYMLGHISMDENNDSSLLALKNELPCCEWANREGHVPRKCGKPLGGEWPLAKSQEKYGSSFLQIQGDKFCQQPEYVWRQIFTTKFPDVMTALTNTCSIVRH